MDCERAQSQIPAYRAGRLDSADRRALECHLSGCHRCASRFARHDSGPTEIRTGAARDHRRTGQTPLRTLL
jgi:anti-sigma factor RsiW